MDGLDYDELFSSVLLYRMRIGRARESRRISPATESHIIDSAIETIKYIQENPCTK